MKPCEFIEKLATENKSMADALENKRFAGMKRILADFYPDNAHFIYELLQNAEDTYASKITFELKNDRLIYQHNGKRTFTERDIESITSIGDSSKADDINSIGKFGVGFKAVFSYTNSPQIYSGDYAFEINNLVLPKCVDNISRNSTDTIFIFPFNHPKKSKLQAFEEIKAGLEKLHENTLLFLKNISEISVITENKSYKIKRNEIDDIQVEIHNSQKNSLSRWLRFKKPLPDYPNLYVSVAYALGENEKTQKDEIIPISGEVSIFFPAEKETSNLKFHIHAPFASTVARDSFKHDNDDNKKLIDLIAEAVVESLDFIKKNDLLALPFLAVLPNSQDDIPNFYYPIIAQSIQAFQKKEFMLTENELFQPSDVCYWGSSNLKKLINDDDLRILTNQSNVCWVKNGPQRNGRIDNFISDLKIDKYSDDEFYGKLQDISYSYGDDESFREENPEDFQKINMLFQRKSDEWYLKFYAFLKDYEESNHVNKEKMKFFIRLQDSSLNLDCKDCFFENDMHDKSYVYAKKETYTIGKKLNEKAKEFLEFLGVTDVGEKEKIATILEDYKEDSFPVFKEHLKHLKYFLEYYKNTLDSEIFKRKYLFSCIDNKGDERWGYSTAIYLDEPYQKTGLKALKKLNSDNIYFLNERYQVELSLKQQKELITLLLELGIKNKLEIIPANIDYNLERNGKLRGVGKNVGTSRREDWIIENLENLLGAKNIDIALLIWKSMLVANEKTFTAINQINKSSERKEADSQLIYFLKTYSWVPDKNGELHKPCDIDENQLSAEFVPDKRNGWLNKIGFGENIRKNQQEYKEKEKIIKEVTGGHSLEDMEALTYVPREVFKAFLAEQKNKNQWSNKIDNKPLDVIGAIQKHAKNISHNDIAIDPAIVKNNEAYLNTLRKQHNHTIQKSTIAKSRNYSTKIKDGRDETIIFLKNQYKGHCQICGFTFTKTDGQNNFEMFDWGAAKITKDKSDLALPASSMCLCPNCHANVKWGSFHPDFLDNLNINDLTKYNFEEFCEGTKTRVEHAEIPECYSFIEIDMYKIPIHLNQEKRFIFYTEEHFLHFFDLACLAHQ